ncbi:MAG TPA: hypothetical protein VEN29_09340 [Casimicrobiaceae bacterium]|nr:hypothetical protein [Casimicrobiaceae bacterium]
MARQTIAWRAVRLLIAGSAVGELAVGIAATVAPGALTNFLLGATVEGTGAVVARMAGIAVAALGLGWWIDRSRLDLSRLRRVAGSYLVYNFGIGALFLAYASTADRVILVSWMVAVIHLVAAGAFIVALARLRPAAETGRA